MRIWYDSSGGGAGVQILYIVTYSAGGGTPSNVQIVAGQNASGAAASWAGNAPWTGSGQYLEATGLAENTQYDSAAVIYDGTTYSNVVEIPGVWVTLATLELGDLINTTIIDSPDLIVSDFSFLLSSLVPSEINSSGGRLTLN
jgi:hypothetical protein